MSKSQQGEIPVWLTSSMSATDADRIEAAVKNAEKRTAAEIVPMIVRRSTLKATGDRILFWICFGILGIGGAVSFAILGGVDEALLDQLIASLGLWPSHDLYTSLSVVAELGVAFAAFLLAYLAAKALSRFQVIHRHLFPVVDQVMEVEHRAQNEFYASDLRTTTGRTGVLLYVSMLERRAVILADEAITKHFDEKSWKDVLETMLTSIRAGEMATGYVHAIEAIATRLEKSFPLLADDRDELSNRLRIYE